MRPHEELLAAGELLDPPHERRLFRYVVDRADARAEFGRVGVVRDRDEDLDVVGGRAALELGLDLRATSYRTSREARLTLNEREEESDAP